jgi:hypothetical protein
VGLFASPDNGKLAMAVAEEVVCAPDVKWLSDARSFGAKWWEPILVTFSAGTAFSAGLRSAMASCVNLLTLAVAGTGSFIDNPASVAGAEVPVLATVAVLWLVDDGRVRSGPGLPLDTGTGFAKTAIVTVAIVAGIAVAGATVTVVAGAVVDASLSGICRCGPIVLPMFALPNDSFPAALRDAWLGAEGTKSIGPTSAAFGDPAEFCTGIAATDPAAAELSGAADWV